MSQFDSIQEFRSALNGLIGSSVRANPRKPKMQHRSSRARRNMAIRRLPDGSWEFDTPEEAMAFASQDLPPARAPRAPRSRSAVDRVAGMAPTKSKPRRKAKKVEDPDGPVDWRDARWIGHSVGGMDILCPGARQGEEKVSFRDALTSMGLTAGKAREVVNMMEEAEVLAKHRGEKLNLRTDADREMARAILFEIGGVTCGIGAKSNPRRGYGRRSRRNPVSWQRDY